MISDELKTVIVKELGLDDWDMQDETVATEVPGWDSLSHVRVITAVEDAFGVRFRSLEVIKLKNVGELQKLVDKKVAAK